MKCLAFFLSDEVFEALKFVADHQGKAVQDVARSYISDSICSDLVEISEVADDLFLSVSFPSDDLCEVE